MVAILATGAIAGFPAHAGAEIPAANADEVALEQFEALQQHIAAGFHVNGCSDCQRYLVIRNLLLKPFEPTKGHPN